jgi:hypothetical protein
VPLSRFDALVDDGTIIDASTILAWAWPSGPGRRRVTGAMTRHSNGAEGTCRLAAEKGGPAACPGDYRRDIAVWSPGPEKGSTRSAGRAIELHLSELRAGAQPDLWLRSTTALLVCFRFLVSEEVIDGDPTADVRSPVCLVASPRP